MKDVWTEAVVIYVGRKDMNTKKNCSMRRIKKAIAGYVNEVGLCVSLTETRFIYTGGGEKGIAVGLINYPRFPSDSPTLRKRSMELAEILLRTCKQHKVSVVFNDKTVMLEA